MGALRVTVGLVATTQWDIPVFSGRTYNVLKSVSFQNEPFPKKVAESLLHLVISGTKMRSVNKDLRKKLRIHWVYLIDPRQDQSEGIACQ